LGQHVVFIGQSVSALHEPHTLNVPTFGTFISIHVCPGQQSVSTVHCPKASRFPLHCWAGSGVGSVAVFSVFGVSIVPCVSGTTGSGLGSGFGSAFGSLPASVSSVSSPLTGRLSPPHSSFLHERLSQQSESLVHLRPREDLSGSTQETGDSESNTRPKKP